MQPEPCTHTLGFAIKAEIDPLVLALTTSATSTTIGLCLALWNADHLGGKKLGPLVECVTNEGHLNILSPVGIGP